MVGFVHGQNERITTVLGLFCCYYGWLPWSDPKPIWRHEQNTVMNKLYSTPKQP
jgi:hypothetical protein